MENHNILSFVIKNENTTTDMLYALLAYKPIRQAIVSLFTNERFGAEDVSWDDIDTQASLGDSIPDLVMIGQ